MGRNLEKLEKRLRKEFETQNLARDREAQKRISAVEADAKAAKEKAAKAELASALDHALSGIPWESLGSRDLARNKYLPLVTRDDAGEFMIEGEPLDVFIPADVEKQHPNLLARSNNTVSAHRGTGGKPALPKPEPIDYDALSFHTGKPELEAAAKHLASVLSQS